MRFIIRSKGGGDDQQRLQNLADQLNASLEEGEKGTLAELAVIATNAWKAKAKMLDNTTGEVRDGMKRVYRHIEAILESLQGMGIEIKDHTNDAFDYGMPLRVVTTQPTAGIAKERVLETIKPTIYWKKQIIQMGEVVIATPMQSQEKA
jgi:hypothetical protein